MCYTALEPATPGWTGRAIRAGRGACASLWCHSSGVLSRGGHTRHNAARQRTRAGPAPVSAGGATPQQENPFNTIAGGKVWAAGSAQHEPSAARATSTAGSGLSPQKTLAHRHAKEVCK